MITPNDFNSVFVKVSDVVEGMATSTLDFKDIMLKSQITTTTSLSYYNCTISLKSNRNSDWTTTDVFLEENNILSRKKIWL